MFRAMKIAGPCLDISRAGWLPRMLALPLLCLLLALSAHVSQAATINVSSSCSLPNAITSANNNSANGGCTAGSGADTINLSGMASPYTLSAALPAVTSDITIAGANKTVSGNDAYRIFRVNSGGNLKLNNITLRNGKAPSLGFGGALFLVASGSATVTSATIHDNAAYWGGAVGSYGTVTVINSTIRDSSADSTAGYGGAFLVMGGTTTIRNSAIHGNSANQGGGIDVVDGTLTVENSLIYSNSANGGNGGAIHQASGTVTLAHSTLWNNQATGSGAGNGVYVSGAASLYLRNSILESTLSSMYDCQLSGGGLSAMKENVGTIIGSGNPSACQRSAVGTASANLSAPSFMPPATSGALGVGNATYCAQYSQDKNGVTRPASACDAGAVERAGATQSLNYIDVDATCSLQNAVTSAQNNSATGGCATGLADAVATDYIRLTQDVSLATSPAGLTSKLVVDGMGRSVSLAAGSTGVRPFVVGDGGDLTLRNITISGGNADQGASIHSRGTLTMENCVVKDSSATLEGGAIHLWHGSSVTSINRCAFINNRSNSRGGAINISLGELAVSNSTFISNSCATDGCAIYVGNADVDLAHNTFWNNVSDSAGNITAVRGGGTTDLSNSILGRDSRLGGALCGGTFQNSTVGRGLIMWNGPTQNNPCGNVTVADPQLGAQTGFPPYLPLGAGSSAIGKGIAAACAKYAIDQRGAPRPAANCDIGALQFYSTLSAVEGGGGTVIYSPTPRTPDPCTGRDLNSISDLRLAASYGLCDGTQFQRLDGSGVGIQWIIDGGLLDAVDVWGWVRPTVEVCFPQAGKTLFVDAAYSPRSVQPLNSFRDGEYTCARSGKAGTIVLMSPDSPHGTAPAATSPGPLVSPAPAQAAPAQPPPEPTAVPSTALSGCMVRTKAILNLRSSPGGAIVGLVPWEAWLTALEHAPGWFKIDFHGAQGWISADYVEPRGTCG